MVLRIGNPVVNRIVLVAVDQTRCAGGKLQKQCPGNARIVETCINYSTTATVIGHPRIEWRSGVGQAAGGDKHRTGNAEKLDEDARGVHH